MEVIAKLQIRVDDLQKHLKAGIENGTFQHGGGRKQRGRDGAAATGVWWQNLEADVTGIPQISITSPENFGSPPNARQTRSVLELVENLLDGHGSPSDAYNTFENADAYKTNEIDE